MKITIFDDIIDERELGKIWHDLQEILTISFFAVLSGAEDYEAIAEYGRQKEEFLRQFLKLENGLPSSSTYARTFRHIDPSILNDCLKKNAEEFAKLQGQYFENIGMLENSLKQFYDFYNFERIHGSTLKLPPVTFWKQWDLNHIHRQVLDEKNRKVKFLLKIEKQRVQKIKLSGNKIQREVLSLNFLGVNLPENSNISKQAVPN